MECKYCDTGFPTNYEGDVVCGGCGAEWADCAIRSDEDQYEVVNPTSLFTGRIGRKEATKIANEITLSFDGPRGRVLASFHPSEIKKA